MAVGATAGKNQDICPVQGGLVSIPGFAPFIRSPEARGALRGGNVLTSSEVHARLHHSLPLLLCQVAISSVSVHFGRLWEGA